MRLSVLVLTTAALLVLPPTACAKCGDGSGVAAGPVALANGTVAPGELQAAIDAAKPGDTLTLQAGQTYAGPFHLPRKNGDAWIVIRSSEAGQLPPGVRVGPERARLMPRLVSSRDSVVAADDAAHHYRFVGVEIAPSPGAFLTNVVELGGGDTTSSALPHHFAFERCYVHGDSVRGSRRGFALNSASTTIADSYIADFKEVGADSQAIAGWNGPGPFEIVNNYLEGAGENVMFGGGDPSIAGLVPSDIVISHNTLTKPARWRDKDEASAGTQWSVKNLLELKNARRVRIEGNKLENNWAASQNGFAILFTVRNQNGQAPWSTVEDVTFENNLVMHVGGAVNILGHDDLQRSQPAHQISIKNNLFVDVGGPWGNGRVFQLLNGVSGVTIAHNTATHTGQWLTGGETLPHSGVIVENNLAVRTSGGAPELTRAQLNQYFPSAVMRGNVIVAASAADVGFVDAAQGDYRLSPSSRYRTSGSDGRDPGVDVAALEASLAGPAEAVPAAAVKKSIALMFWIAVGLLVYVYAGYAMLAWLVALVRPKPVQKNPATRPSVTVIVAAHNEGARISQRIANLLREDYPGDRLEIIAASDGSTDDTVARLSAFGDRIQVLAGATRRGKTAMLNDALAHAHGDIVVLTDARQEFARDAIANLVANFADPSVGAVSGELVLRAREGDDQMTGIGLYWRCEKLIRIGESRIDSSVGATGAIYAVRRQLVGRIPDDTILDDVLIPLQVSRQGYRVVFDSTARAFDVMTATPQDEFARKVRTIAGTFQLFSRERWLLSPRQNRLWLQVLSHKALRLVAPLLHLTALATNLALLGSPFYVWTLAAQLGFYVAACAGWLSPGIRGVIRLVSLPYTVCLMIVATVVAFARHVRGSQPVTWERARVVTS